MPHADTTLKASPTRRTPLPSPHYAWFVVVLLLVVWMLNYLDRQVIFSLFPLLQGELHISNLQLGLLGTAFLWVYALCSPWAGHIADRFGKKRMICGSLFVWSMITLLTGSVHSFRQLIVLRSLMGVSEACYLPAGLALIAAFHGERTRSRAISLHYSGTYIGTVLGGVLGGWAGVHYGWRPVFLGFGVIGCAYGAFLLFALRERSGDESVIADDVQDKVQFGPALRVILRAPGYKKVLAVFAIASICDWAIYTWMPLYLYESFHFSLTKAGFTATFYMKSGGFAGLLIGGFLADAWAQRSSSGRAFTQCAGLFLAAPFLMASGVTRNVILLYLGMTLFGIGKGIYDGNTMPVLCERVPPQMRATAFGLLNFAGTFSGGVIAAAAGGLKNTLGLGHTFLFCGVLLLFGAVLIGTVRTSSIDVR